MSSRGAHKSHAAGGALVLLAAVLATGCAGKLPAVASAPQATECRLTGDDDDACELRGRRSTVTVSVSAGLGEEVYSAVASDAVASARAQDAAEDDASAASDDSDDSSDEGDDDEE